MLSTSKFDQYQHPLHLPEEDPSTSDVGETSNTGRRRGVPSGGNAATTPTPAGPTGGSKHRHQLLRHQNQHHQQIQQMQQSLQMSIHQEM